MNDFTSNELNVLKGQNIAFEIILAQLVFLSTAKLNKEDRIKTLEECQTLIQCCLKDMTPLNNETTIKVAQSVIERIFKMAKQVTLSSPHTT